MSKYTKQKLKSTPKGQRLTAQDAKDEKEFWKWAIIITVITIIVIYFIFR
ncbi:MAG: hypothetical protein J5I52_10425 [Saprospiraceae bacterium]|nr:MAG: hypothetical protein UZ09_BCD002001497 [Bacteroidetes bacterium OLB9]MCO6464548.1 hypothetical protein [Saprospiraceae bacterium]MCZ2339003.1 hypothetical protein [Chitinophagales bacterium]